MNTGLHGANGLSPETSYVIYRAYVLPGLLYSLDVLGLKQGQMDQFSRYHIQTLRNIQNRNVQHVLQYMLLGALPLQVELHKRRLSLLNSVINSDNECLQGLVQRQLACSFNVKSSFCKFKRIVGKPNFSDQFKKIVKRYIRVGYNLDIMRQSACLVLNPITVYSYGFLFNCTTVGQASDSMTALT